MSGARVIVGLVMLGAAALAVTAYARQAEPMEEGGDWFPSLPSLDLTEWAESALPVDDISSEIWNLGSEVDNMKNIDVGANVGAFLAVIRLCEGTANSADPYRVCYSYRHTVQNMADHPAVTGEWRGERLPASMCKGYTNNVCYSTAAGAYQFIKPTWLSLKAKLGLPDFGPASQDAAAVQLLRDCGAYERLAVGDLEGAVQRASRNALWASLPGAKAAGQGMRSMSQVAAWYSGAGGAIA